MLVLLRPLCQRRRPWLPAPIGLAGDLLGAGTADLRLRSAGRAQQYQAQLDAVFVGEQSGVQRSLLHRSAEDLYLSRPWPEPAAAMVGQRLATAEVFCDRGGRLRGADHAVRLLDRV